MFEVGQPLPSFSLNALDGATRTNTTYAGKWLVLHVYPKLAFEKIMFQYMKGDASGNLGPAQAPPPSWDVTSGTKI